MYDRQNFVDGQVLKAAHLNHMEDELVELSRSISDLTYKAIEIVKFAVTPSVALLGSTVTEITFTWGFNKPPVKVLLNNVEQDVDSSGIAIETDLTTNTTWTLEVTDERGLTVHKKVTLPFYNYIVYGVCTKNQDDGITPVDGKTTKTLSNSRSRTFSVTAEDGEYIMYAIPSRLGTPTFSVGGFEGGFVLHQTVDDQTWGTEYTEAYDYYISSNPGLGNTKVVVS